MKRFVVSVAIASAVVACSGTSGDTVHEESPTLGAPATKPPPKDEPPGPSDRGDAGADADADAKKAGDEEKASVGGCASCTAGSCGKELQACAAVRACVDGLVAFNDCFAKQTDGTSGSCGETFAKTSEAAEVMWSCLEAKCAGRCGAK